MKFHYLQNKVGVVNFTKANNSLYIGGKVSFL